MNLKLSCLYFFYFALLGVMAPYLGLYLNAQGFSLLEVAQLMSILMLTKVFAPLLWAFFSDRYQCHLLMVRFGALMTLLCYFGFFQAEGYLSFAVVIFLFSFFWNAVLPQIEVITLHNLGEKKDLYSRIRLWGSVGFILSVILVGLMIDGWGVLVFPYVLLVIMVFILAISLLSFKEPVCQSRVIKRSNRFWNQLNQNHVLIFYLVCFLLQVSHGTYYTYFSIYLEELSYDKSIIGGLWALGVVAEVVLFVVMHRWFAYHTLKTIIVFSMALTFLRWVLTPVVVESLPLLVLLQCLHAFSFGAMHAVAIRFVHHQFELRNQGRAQALYSSIGFGAGGAVGALCSGWVVNSFGYEASFYFSALTALVGMLLALQVSFLSTSEQEV